MHSGYCAQRTATCDPQPNIRYALFATRTPHVLHLLTSLLISQPRAAVLHCLPRPTTARPFYTGNSTTAEGGCATLFASPDHGKAFSYREYIPQFGVCQAVFPARLYWEASRYVASGCGLHKFANFFAGAANSSRVLPSVGYIVESFIFPLGVPSVNNVVRNREASRRLHRRSGLPRAGCAFALALAGGLW